MLLQIHPDNPNPREIAMAIEALQNNGLIIYPTDTVYALGCDIFNRDAVLKICKIKNVKPDKINFSINKKTDTR